MAKTNSKHKYTVFFDIVEKGPKGEYKLLVDNFGYICGIYPNYRKAKEAIPKIRRNIVNHLKKRDRKVKATNQD